MVAERPSFTGARWVLTDVAAGRVDELRSATGLSEPIARVLASRWDGPGTPDGWLTPSLDHLHDPLDMRNMDAALDRIRSALRRREKIRIVTDYDVDGTTSSLVLQAVLRLVEPAAEIDFHIPSRFDEGYGFSPRAAAAAGRDGVGLVITADVGVRDHEAVGVARSAGVDVLVCDHHLPAGESVPADAIVLCPPQAGCAYKNRALAACGVSLKVAQALLADRPDHDRIVRSLLKLAAIGTVADMVSLATLENRAIVALGLAELSRGPHAPGLRALLAVAGLDRPAHRIAATDLGFRIGPRINAAGRIAEAKLVVDLLQCRDPDEAARMARQLDQHNTERRDIQRRLVDRVVESIKETAPDPFVVVAGPEEDGWHRGVVGIVASRLKDDLLRPVAVLSVQGEIAVGSVRSVPGLHAVRALESVSDLLLKFGGHPAAAGFTLRACHVPALRQRLAAWAAAHRDGDPVHVREADAIVSAAGIDPALAGELDRLEPFGNGNAAPRFVVPAVRPFAIQRKGAGEVLLKFLVPRGEATAIEAVWWRHAALADAIAGQPVDLLTRIGTNTWNGETRMQLEVEDVRTAA